MESEGGEFQIDLLDKRNSCCSFLSPICFLVQVSARGIYILLLTRIDAGRAEKA